MLTIQIAYEVSDAAVARVEALLEDVTFRDSNWSGAEFRIERADFTGIDSCEGYDPYDTAALFSQVEAAISGDVEG